MLYILHYRTETVGVPAATSPSPTGIVSAYQLFVRLETALRQSGWMSHSRFPVTLLVTKSSLEAETLVLLKGTLSRKL